MTSIREFERQVLQAEGIRVVLRATQDHADANHNLRSYRVGKAIADDCTVRRFKIILEAYTDIPFTIVGGNGLTPSRDVTLGEIRATYKPHVKTAKKKDPGITLKELTLAENSAAQVVTTASLMGRAIVARKKAKDAMTNLMLHGLNDNQARGILRTMEIIARREKVNVPLKTRDDQIAEEFLRNMAKLMGFKDVSFRKIVEMFLREMSAAPGSATGTLTKGTPPSKIKKR